ncbi:phosphotransferase-like protein [Altererythrobacter sp. MF3-039]|uniref:phosphotransferase-like protein n=1 Tax=Altererythrobacter sp. MF3-039 TaxID=3252901 RepID=UPI00390CA25E
MAKVIVLNGVSSAGKSSLARAIQHQARSTILHVEMDKFISFLPDGHELRPEWFRLEKTKVAGRELPRIRNGDRGAQLLKVMRGFVAQAADAGLDLVVDEVCEAIEIADYRRRLRGCELYVAKVFAPIDIIETRERERGDRLVGLARGQAEYLHAGIEYDHEIDTSKATPEKLTKELLDRLAW